MNNDYIKNRVASVVVEKKKLISKGNIEALLSGIFAFSAPSLRQSLLLVMTLI